MQSGRPKKGSAIHSHTLKTARPAEIIRNKKLISINLNITRFTIIKDNAIFVTLSTYRTSVLNPFQRVIIVYNVHKISKQQYVALTQLCDPGER